MDPVKPDFECRSMEWLPLGDGLSGFPVLRRQRPRAGGLPGFRSLAPKTAPYRVSPSPLSLPHRVSHILEFWRLVTGKDHAPFFVKIEGLMLLVGERECAGRVFKIHDIMGSEG